MKCWTLRLRRWSTYLRPTIDAARFHPGGPWQQINQKLTVGADSILGVLATTSLDAVAVDEVVCRMPVLGTWLSESHRGPVIEVAPDADLYEIERIAGWLVDFRPTTVLVIGGGNTLDAAKLARIASTSPSQIGRWRKQAQRSSLLTVEQARRDERWFMAIPTTVGTGSEVSSVACLRIQNQRLLLRGRSLHFDEAILDSVATSTLSATAVWEGLFEAFVRILGPVVNTPEKLTIPDIAAESLLGSLALMLRIPKAGLCDADTRLTAGWLSASTHTTAALKGRPPVGSPLWFVANELATNAGINKVKATTALVGPWLRHIVAGDDRWGFSDRVWYVTRSLGLSGPEELEQLLRHPSSTGLGFSEAEIPALAATTIDRWGGRRLVLGRFAVEDIEAILREACDGAPGSDEIGAT